jgi:hypothetical protein
MYPLLLRRFPLILLLAFPASAQLPVITRVVNGASY